MLVDRFGKEIPKRITVPSDSEFYMGQRSGETGAQYLARQRREGVREAVAIIVIVSCFVVGLFWVALHGRS